ncbi:MAG TPA: PorT family protein [Candidatus Eisenbacteria bacterium]|uniref:PorT family protein n=1 Tax=Eiseniibacteriota bacterium TaxID=2212470 RepID=A0A7V2F3C0_UNCEI|nr:PorT family protein [Candidatus Eisenbacteria bacterium]
MKKLSIILMAIVIVAFATNVFAQDKPYYFGLKAGLNMSKAWGDDAEDESYAMGMAAGVAMGYHLHELFDIMPEVMFMWKGSKSEFVEEGFYEGDITWKLYYIDINVLGKLKIPMEGMISPYLVAGPYLGIKAAHGWSSDPEIPEEGGEALDEVLDEYLKSTDFGAVLGAGVDIMMDNGHMISIEGRYGIGLANLFDPMPVDETTEEEMDFKMSSITFLVGYSF